jgi:cell division septum initiation protein DivIVA
MGSDNAPDQNDAQEPELGSQTNGGGSARSGVPTAIEDVDFPISIRGYDREAVDGYVSRVREIVMELEATHSPEAAVKEALEKVGAKTKGILEHAGETAEQITVAAREEAEEMTARTKEEAEQIVAKANAQASEILARSNAEAEATVSKAQKEAAEQLRRSREEVTALREKAEARLHDLNADTEKVRQERGQLLDEIREFAARVEEVASAADARFPVREAADKPEKEAADVTAEAPAEKTGAVSASSDAT